MKDFFFFDLALCSRKMTILQNEIEKYDEDDEVPGTGVGGCHQFYSGETFTILWRGLEAEAAEYVVLIPFISDEENRPAILICPDWENGRQRMMDEGMKMAKTIFELGCHLF